MPTCAETDIFLSRQRHKDKTCCHKHLPWDMTVLKTVICFERSPMKKPFAIIFLFMIGLISPTSGLASEILEVGSFQAELLGPGESAASSSGWTVTGTTAWTEEQKTALISSLGVLNLSLANSAARPVRIAMAWSNNLPQQILGNALSSRLLDPTAGELQTTAEATWRDGNLNDSAPGMADIVINDNNEFNFHYGEDLPRNLHNFQTLITHEVIHGLGLPSG